MLRLRNPTVFDDFDNYFLGGAQRALSAKDRFWEGFGDPLRAFWGPLLGMLEELWSFLGIFWVQNGARNVKMRAPKAILARVEVARGSQRHSMGRFWGDVPHLLCVVLYFDTFSCKKV